MASPARSTTPVVSTALYADVSSAYTWISHVTSYYLPQWDRWRALELDYTACSTDELNGWLARKSCNFSETWFLPLCKLSPTFYRCYEDKKCRQPITNLLTTNVWWCALQLFSHSAAVYCASATLQKSWPQRNAPWYRTDEELQTILRTQWVTDYFWE